MIAMAPGVVEVKPLDGYNLWVKFEDGKSGALCLDEQLYGPVFVPL